MDLRVRFLFSWQTVSPDISTQPHGATASVTGSSIFLDVERGGKNGVLPARLELAIFGLVLEFQAHMDYETDALPTEPRKHYIIRCYDCPIPFDKLVHSWSVNTKAMGFQYKKILVTKRKSIL